MGDRNGQITAEQRQEADRLRWNRDRVRRRCDGVATGFGQSEEGVSGKAEGEVEGEVEESHEGIIARYTRANNRDMRIRGEVGDGDSTSG